MNTLYNLPGVLIYLFFHLAVTFSESTTSRSTFVPLVYKKIVKFFVHHLSEMVHSHSTLKLYQRDLSLSDLSLMASVI